MDDEAEPRRTAGHRRPVRRPRVTGRPGVRPLLSAGALSLLVLGLSACTGADPAPLPASPSTAPTPTASATPTAALVDAVFGALPSTARTAPAFTWDSAGAIGQGEAADGDTVLLLAAACDSGGELTITVNEDATVLDCGRLAAAGPIDVTAAIGSDAPAGVEVTVRPTSGHPRYLAKAVSLPPGEAVASPSAR